MIIDITTLVTVQCRVAGGGPVCIYTQRGHLQIPVLLHRVREKEALHQLSRDKKSDKIGAVSVN